MTVIVISSCNDSSNKEISTWKLYVNGEFDAYRTIYGLANDSLVKWVNDSLGIAKTCFLYPHKLDSILVFNKSKTRFYSTVNISGMNDKTAISDEIQDFGGAKINGKWYFFFMGVSRPVLREDWQDSIYAPLSFEELSYVAYHNLFKTLVKNINEGHPEKNEEIFNNRIFYDKECSITNNPNKCIEEAILRKVAGEYKYKLDPNEIASIQSSIAESKLPEGVPLVKSYSWWEIYKYGQKPFETKAWKEYMKQKYGKE